MKDRVPAAGMAGRMQITPQNGDAPYFAIVAMADGAAPGFTPLNKATLLNSVTTNALDLDDDTATPNDAFQAIIEKLDGETGGAFQMATATYASGVFTLIGVTVPASGIALVMFTAPAAFTEGDLVDIGGVQTGVYDQTDSPLTDDAWASGVLVQITVDLAGGKSFFRSGGGSVSINGAIVESLPLGTNISKGDPCKLLKNSGVFVAHKTDNDFNSLTGAMGAGYAAESGVTNDIVKIVTIWKRDDTLLQELAVGDEVMMRVNGTMRPFIVVQHGLPSAMYDTSFTNSTTLLMKEVYEQRAWATGSSNDYAGSAIHSYLNSTFLNLFDASVANKMVSVRIPYRPGNGTGSTVNSGANGLQTKIYLLSVRELGWTSGNFSADGAVLSYFFGAVDTDARRIAYLLTGGVSNWWTRSPSLGYAASAALVGGTGGLNTGGAVTNSSAGMRPALVLPYTTVVNPDGSIT